MPDALKERLQIVLGDVYHVERELPAGGMSRLFVATERSLERDVVVKVLPPELASEVSAARFQREMSLAAHLQHPHILPVLSAGSRDGLLFYIMPYVRGESLRDRLRREGRLPIADAARILGEVAGALAYAHDRGVVHRDVKPENVLLEAGHAVLADFGIARAMAGDDRPTTGERLTATGVSLGTPGYMAPEQIVGDSAVDARTDVYALAVVGYEMLAGTAPFDRPSTRAALAAQFAAPPPSVKTLRPDTPAHISDAIDRALNNDPAARPATGAEFLQSLGATAAPAAPAGPMSPPSGVSWASRRTAALLAAALVLAAAGWGIWRLRQPPVAPISASTVAVLPFAASGPASLSYLGTGMVDLLSTTLDGAGDLHSVDPRAVLAAASRVVPTALDVSHAQAIARQLGAGRFVLGSVVGASGHLRASATLYEGSSGTAIVRASTDGDTSDVFGLVDRLAAQLITSGHTGPSARITKLASVTTQSLPALKAYLEGETAMRENNFHPAIAAFQRAIAADSTFALAYFRLSIAQEWVTHTVDAAWAAEQAVRLGEHLSPHDRQLLAGLNASRRGDIPEATRLFRSLLTTYPDDYEAWWQLGELQFHSAPVVGMPLADAEPAFRHVLDLDPQSEPALVHLARIAAAGGRRAALDSLAARSLAAAPTGDRSFEMRIDRAVMDGDSATFATLLGELTQIDDFDTFLPAWSLTLYVQNFEAAARTYVALTDRSRPPDVRARGTVLLAALDVLHGRMVAADAKMDQVPGLSVPWALEYRGLIATLPYRPVDTARVRATRAALEHWDAAAASDVINPAVEFSANNGLHPMIRAYLIGILAADQGDTSGATRASKSILALPAARDHAALAGTLAAAVMDELSWGGHASTPTAAEPKIAEFYEWLIGSPIRSEARERFRRAQALAAAGQDTAAIRWFSSFDNSASDDVLYLAPSHLERARLYARLGQRALAAEQYRRFIALWQRCDPPLRPVVAEAEHDLAVLK
jgi:TolB-like protein/Flp pilus assembly protein TadD